MMNPSESSFIIFTSMTRTSLFVAVVLLVLGTGIVAAIVLDWIPLRNSRLANGVESLEQRAEASEPSDPPLSTHSAPLKLPPGVQVKFVDVTEQSGIHFVHFDGHTELEYIMETTGSGIGWLDFDQDGLMDLFIVQGSEFPGTGKAQGAYAPRSVEKGNNPPTSKLFKNLGGGRFRDVTSEVGLDHVGCGQGVAIGDIDNDGFPDLFLTCYGKPNVLYHNVSDGKGGRRFEDITARAGLGDHPDWHDRPNFSTSSAFLDYNNDGRLDLFVCSYVHVDLENYPSCKDNRGKWDSCPPSAFKGTRCILYRNNGDLTFTDVSKEAGIDVPNAKALGVVALDLDGDGLVDIFVANDSVPNFLFRNLGNGRFESLGPSSGCAVNLAGNPQGYMGVDADDLDGDGRPDIVVANGHVSKIVDDDGNPDNTFRQQAQLYVNDGRGRFQHISKV